VRVYAKSRRSRVKAFTPDDNFFAGVVTARAAAGPGPGVPAGCAGGEKKRPAEPAELASPGGRRAGRIDERGDRLIRASTARCPSACAGERL
jgi:hypothetical protein